MDTAFQEFEMPSRQPKPRTRGLSMMIEWGIGIGQQQDLIESAGEYIDFAKIAGGIARFMPRDLLSRKLALYRENGISTSPGGLFAELAIKTGKYELLVEETKRAGFSGIEISDNLLKIPGKEKAEAIAYAKDSGLTVFGEVGKKEGLLEDDELIEDVANCLKAGADWIYLEAAELFVGNGIREHLVKRLRQSFPAEKLIYELPIHLRVSSEYSFKIAKWLVKEMGTEVNIANIECTEIYTTELARRGFAGDLSHPQGAYRLAGFVE